MRRQESGPTGGGMEGWLIGMNGAGGIRTPETLSRLHDFKSCAFNRSATAPWSCVSGDARRGRESRGRGSAAATRATAVRKETEDRVQNVGMEI